MSLADVQQRLNADKDCKSAKITERNGKRVIKAVLSSPHSEQAGGGNFVRIVYYDGHGDQVD